MRVRAKHHINYNGTWHKPGDVFEMSTTDIDDIADLVDIEETPIVEPAPGEEEKRPAARRRKAED